MTMSRDTALEEWARRILAGETMPEEELEALGPVYGWRLLRWEADIPLPEEQRAQLQEYARSSMRMLGVCACREEDEDAFTLLQNILEESGELSQRVPYTDLVNTEYAQTAAK